MARLPRLDDLQRLAVMHGLSAAADAFFTVSLADSLFFNVSVEAARPRLLLYLAVTMAPFAVLAPLIGPFIDRVRGGQRTVLVAACVGRAALTLALVQDLRSLFMFPEAFGVLVLGKAYSIGRNATVPRIVGDETELVGANAFLARVGLVGGSIGGGTAALVLATNGAALVLYLATVLFIVAALTAATVASPKSSPRRQSRLEYLELHAVRLTRAMEAMGLLRASVGMLTFLLGFELKRSGAPVWHFGLVLVAGGMGAMAATVISGRLRAHFSEERILVLSLVAPAVVALVGVLQFSIVTAVMVSATVGAAASVGKHVFDAFVQRTAPDANMARAFAGFETRFQLFWITGATVAIATQADPRLGLLVMSLVLGGGAVAVDVSLHTSDRFEASPGLVAAVTQLVLEDAPAHDAPGAVLDAAEVLLKGGSTRAAVIVTAAALDAHCDLALRPEHEIGSVSLATTSARVTALRESVMKGCSVTTRDTERVIADVRAAIESDHPPNDRSENS
ncbi:MAG: MFS transporter [Acidimicrobiia bacterium]|nr:MFS transporter [Acidimicrobiia bacterium]